MRNLPVRTVLPLLLAGAALHAQQPRHAGKSAFAPDPRLNPPTFRASTGIVLVPALVKERSGKILYGLKPADFALYDSGVRQRIRVDRRLDTRPVSLVVCVERGRDAYLQFNKLRRLGPLLDRFVVGNRGRVALVTFDSHPTWVDPFTSNTALIARDLATLPRGDDGAAIRDAAGYSVNLLEQQPSNRRRILLLISESRDHGSRHFGLPQLVERIGTSNTLVVSLVFSPAKAEMLAWAKGGSAGDEGYPVMNPLAPLLTTVDAMRRNTPGVLASLSGGEYAPFTREKTLESSVRQFAGDALDRYAITFHPTDPTPGLHTLQLKLAAGPTRQYGARVLARDSYWAIQRNSAGGVSGPPDHP